MKIRIYFDQFYKIRRFFENGRLKEEGLTVLLVEQYAREALDLADRGYVLQTGRIVGEGTGKALLERDMFREAFLGI